MATQSPAFRAMKLVVEKMTDEQIIALMVKEPRLIRRPLIVIDGTPVIGFDQAKLKEVLE